MIGVADVLLTGCVGATSESNVSLKQCGELKCGTVRPHGPGDTL